MPDLCSPRREVGAVVSRAPRVVRLFLSVDTVSYRRPAGEPADLFYRETRPLRFRAVWVTRRTTSDLYKSKLCATQAEAVKLARAYLARLNKEQGPNFEATYGHPPTVYVDTTDQPERFGYSHQDQP